MNCLFPLISFPLAQSVLKRYGKMAQASLDEAYLNITDYLKESGMTIDAAMESLRQTMKEETALTVSCGVGCNKLLAKVRTFLIFICERFNLF